MGLAPDGGLFVPERIPQVDMERVESGRAVVCRYGGISGL